MDLSKRLLGISYLVGTGLGLSALFLIKLVLVPSADLLNLSSTVSGMVLALALIYAGYWLIESDLDEEQVWTVAQWSGMGVAILTVLSVALYLSNELTTPPSYWRTYLVVSNIGAGGVVGALIGGVSVLRLEHQHVRQLNQRNEVMNRVLRHNIRNQMNVVLAHADAVEEDVPPAKAPSIEQIRSSAHTVLNMSDTAREVSTLVDEPPRPRPVDLGDILKVVVDDARKRFPDVRFDTDVPETAWIKAGEGVEILVRELIDNAARHNQEDVAVSCVVTETRSGRVSLRVEDNGERIHQSRIEAIETAAETPLVRGSGMGLHLVKWLAEIYDGSIEITSDTFGTVVELTLPKAWPLGSPDSTSTNHRALERTNQNV